MGRSEYVVIYFKEIILYVQSTLVTVASGQQ